MKIGIFGGTFNPIHTAHIRLARQCGGKLGLDRVVLVPTAIPPHKEAVDLASSEDRLAMCRLAVRDEPGFFVSELEIARTGKSYTADTLKELEKLYPGSGFYLLLGGDMFLSIQTWRDPEEIYARAVLCAMARHRDEYELLLAHKLSLEALGVRCRVLDIPPEPMSSTQIRQLVRAGERLEGFLPPAVKEYIESRRLYRGEEETA